MPQIKASTEESVVPLRLITTPDSELRLLIDGQETMTVSASNISGLLQALQGEDTAASAINSRSCVFYGDSAEHTCSICDTNLRGQGLIVFKSSEFRVHMDCGRELAEDIELFSESQSQLIVSYQL